MIHAHLRVKGPTIQPSTAATEPRRQTPLAKLRGREIQLFKRVCEKSRKPARSRSKSNVFSMQFSVGREIPRCFAQDLHFPTDLCICLRRFDNRSVVGQHWSACNYRPISSFPQPIYEPMIL